MVFGIVYISVYSVEKADFKNVSEIEQYENSTHPIIKYYTKILSVFDSKLVITDSKRVIEDYDQMKLKRLYTSKHLVQKDGYSHALDLRSKNCSKFRNNLVKF